MPILTVEIIEWRKFIDYFGLSIEANPFKVGKKDVYLSPSSANIHITRHRLDTYFNMQPQHLCLYKLAKDLADKIALHISSVLRYLQLSKILIFIS